jgi:hypothetical protein
VLGVVVIALALLYLLRWRRLHTLRRLIAFSMRVLVSLAIAVSAVFLLVSSSVADFSALRSREQAGTMPPGAGRHHSKQQTSFGFCDECEGSVLGPTGLEAGTADVSRSAELSGLAHAKMNAGRTASRRIVVPERQAGPGVECVAAARRLRELSIGGCLRSRVGAISRTDSRRAAARACDDSDMRSAFASIMHFTTR